MTEVLFPEGFLLESLAKRHPRTGFSSGQEAVDRFFRERALQSQEKRLSSTRVLWHAASERVAGYYSLAMGQVGFGALPEETVRKLPKRDLPIAILAWLGVDRGFQKRGLGERLLARALRDCWEASQTFPFVAVVFDCLDEQTRGFYQRWDFQEVPGHPLRLFLGADHLALLMRE